MKIRDAIDLEGKEIWLPLRMINLYPQRGSEMLLVEAPEWIVRKREQAESPARPTAQNWCTADGELSWDN